MRHTIATWRAACVLRELLGSPQDPNVTVQERHLGLHMPGEDGDPTRRVAALASLLSSHVDLDALLEMCADVQLPAVEAPSTPSLEVPSTPGDSKLQTKSDSNPDNKSNDKAESTVREQTPQKGKNKRKGKQAAAAATETDAKKAVRIAIAKDAAFCFYYHE